ncbi:MAG: flagellar basal body rod protein FlgC [Desulfococcaceae bacterium]|jgi:flagellar basal-body rod protein FlgC|nr:flagellar basal body rod protein FlgC [Desulfococcaceae bacterium]
MSLHDTFRISASALTAQRVRMNVIASNLANINTMRTAGGGPYQRKDVVFAAVPQQRSFAEELRFHTDESAVGVKVAGIIEDQRAFRKQYAPGHPDADEAGYIQMPNVNPIEEMVNMISAENAYAANVSAVDAGKKMAAKALEIGR